jgi:hypothetical protein
MRKSVLTTAIAAAALALSACAGDGTGPGGGTAELTASEITQLNQAILGVSAGVRGRAGGRFSTEPVTGEGSGSMTFDFDETVPCQPSGDVGIAGTMALSWDDVAQSTGLSADFSVAHDGCAVRLENGETVTLSGDPDIDVLMDAAAGPNGLTAFRITETGAFTWSKGAGASGRCTVAVVADLNVATGAVTLSGEFCGMNVSGTYQGD